MFDVVIQGPSSNKLADVVASYRKPYIGSIIYSGWEGDLQIQLPADVRVVLSKKPQTAGGGNVNLQLQSSKSGMALTTNQLVLKTRSDLILDGGALDKLEAFHLHDSKILTIAISPNYSFFTWDFLYFGSRDSLNTLFNADFDENPNHYPNLLKAIIPETYITANYIAKFDSRVLDICKNPEHYLVQGRPGYAAGKSVSNEVVGTYFKPLPPIDVIWTKYYTNYTSTRDLMVRFGRHHDIFNKSW